MSSKHLSSKLNTSWNKLQEPKALFMPRSTKLRFVLPLPPSHPCGHLPLIDFGLFPNSSVGQRREQTSFSCIIDQPCVSPLSIKQSFIFPTNDYICIYSTLEDDRRIPRLGNESFIISTFILLLRNSCFPRGKASGQCTKEPTVT